MTDISVIILAGKEEIHIRRCLERIAPLKPRQVFVVESQKGDRTHERAIEVAEQLQWRVKGGGLGGLDGLGGDRRAMAEKKVAEWLAGVDTATFEADLRKLVEEKTASGEYRFNRAEDRELAMQGARRFFADFARKIVLLSDGRCVYFVPDPRASERNASNALSWAEYAFHAVSAGGAKVSGTNYNERWFNPHKVRNLRYLEEALKAERCFVRLSKVDCRYDSVMFAGESHDGESVQVVTRLDEMGNMDANLSEVTFNAARRQEKKLPRFVPLTEAVQTVVHHQITAGSYPQDEGNIANLPSSRKGDVVGVGVGDRRRGEVGVGVGDRRRGEVGVESRRRGERGGTALHLVWHDWPGLYAKQFNWALDNLPIEGAWVLRLDADEYLTEETIEKLAAAKGLAALPDNVAGLNIELKRRFCGGEIRHGTTGIRQARIFRYGRGRCEERAMDEHIVVDGEVVDFDGAFYDDNLNDMDWWREKHRGYAKREAKDALAFARGEVHFKRSKEMYYRQPRYLRAVVYFGVRYFLKGGILDGYAGWMWNFWQGLWYRWLVDVEVGKLKKAGGR